jgi:hypothetical protein
MSVSLYAEGQSDIEVGRYGMTLEEARNAFLKVVKETGNEVEGEIGRGNFRLEFNYEKNRKLLYKLANVNDLHGDAPTDYRLREITDVPAGEYVRTGTYSD